MTDSDSSFMRIDDANGVPHGFLDTKVVVSGAARMALLMAGHCNDQAKLQDISNEVLAEVGAEHFVGVLAAAVQYLAGTVLAGVAGGTDPEQQAWRATYSALGQLTPIVRSTEGPGR